MTTAVIYARYSSSNQREESIAGQLRECRQYASKNGMKIIHEYTDSALTGTSDKRPAFQQMVKDSEKHAFTVVIVWKLDRFARNRYDSATYRNILKKNGVKVISAMENISDSPPKRAYTNTGRRCCSTVNNVQTIKKDRMQTHPVLLYSGTCVGSKTQIPTHQKEV